MGGIRSSCFIDNNVSQVRDGILFVSRLCAGQRDAERDAGPIDIVSGEQRLALGWRRALGALSGDLFAIGLLATLSVVRVSALLVACPIAFLALRLLGASYVIWLGWSYIRSPLATGRDSRHGDGPARGSMALWLQSFGVGISNPQAVLFFAGLFPQFIPSESGPSVLALLAVTFVIVKLIVLGGYALGARHLVRRLRRPDRL